MRLWEQFHDKLPLNNSNGITSDLCGIFLKSKLYGLALHFPKGIPDDVIASDKGVAAIVSTFYKCDAFSVVNEVYKYFTDLLSVLRHVSESFKNFEALFSAQVSNLSAHGTTAYIHESLLAIMLLSSSLFDASRQTDSYYFCRRGLQIR